MSNKNKINQSMSLNELADVLFVSRKLSVLTATFTSEHGLAGFISAKDDGSGGDNWSSKTCKVPIKCHSQQTNSHCFDTADWVTGRAAGL